MPIVKQKFCESSWLITEINMLRCTVSKMSKFQDSIDNIANYRIIIIW